MAIDFDHISGSANPSGDGIVKGAGSVAFSGDAFGNLFDGVTVGSGGGSGTLRSVWHVAGVAQVIWQAASRSRAWICAGGAARWVEMLLREAVGVQAPSVPS